MTEQVQGRDAAPAINRETASQLNPLIGKYFTEDTLADVVGVMTDLGYLLSQVASATDGQDLSFGRLYHFCDIVAAALSYEIENLRPCGASMEKILRERAEAGHE